MRSGETRQLKLEDCKAVSRWQSVTIDTRMKLTVRAEAEVGDCQVPSPRDSRDPSQSECVAAGQVILRRSWARVVCEVCPEAVGAEPREVVEDR